MNLYRQYSCPAEKLRALIARPQGVLAFGVEGALGALCAERAGVEVIYAGGWSIAGARARPDMGQVTMTEQRDALRDIVRATSLPVLGDMDDGYGDAKNAERTTSEFFGFLEHDFETRAVRRLAALHIEDQVLPKRCGHVAGKKLVSREEMAGKVRAVCRVRDDLYGSGIIIARTDAYNGKDPGSMQDAIERADACAEAGADLVWAEFNCCDVRVASDFAEGVHRFHSNLPLAFNYSPSLRWIDEPEEKRLTQADLAALGFKFVFVTIADWHAHALATYDYAEAFARDGVRALWDMQAQKRGHPTEHHQALMRVDAWQQFEREFIPEAAGRQKKGEGFHG